MSPTTSTTPITQEAEWPPSGWLTKQQAAEILGLSPERIAAMGQDSGLEVTPAKPLSSMKQRNPQTKQLITLVHKGTVERELWKRNHPNEVVGPVNKHNNPDNKPNKQLALPSPEGPDNIANYIMPANFDPHCWPAWLTLRQATVYSGMPKSWLVDFAENAPAHKVTSPVRVRDLGKGARGGRWRFHRESLEKA